MSTVIKPATFSKEMLDYLQIGASKRAQLLGIGNNIASHGSRPMFPHYYFSSPPGLGKTMTMSLALQKSAFHYVSIHNITEAAFGIELCLINHHNPGVPVYILVDDCNDLFRNIERLNILKQVLVPNGYYHYQRANNAWLNNLEESQLAAVQAHMDPSYVGYKVPTHNMMFIFCANDELVPQKTKGGVNLVPHLKAIHSRIQNVYHFDLPELETWGWIADAVCNGHANINSLVPVAIKEEALTFMYNNFSAFKETSIRTVEALCDQYMLSPNNYRTNWNNFIL